MNTNIIDIRGKDLHFVKHVLNRQQTRNISDVLTLEALLTPRGQLQWSEDFIYRLESEGLLRFEDGRVYATDLSIRSINEKYKRESRLIEEHILDDFEYAFLMFMNNRNEPVHLFDFPTNFKYHSKIDGQPVPGSTNAFYDWMTDIEKYIHDPTIDGYILNHTGKVRFEKLKKERELKAEKEILEMQKLRGDVDALANILIDYDATKSRAKWGFIISIITVIVVVLTLIVRLTQGKP
jgi:hypothetical protein